MFCSVPLPYATDAVACYEAIADLPWAVWLDSGGTGRYDILCAQPVTTLLSRGAETAIAGATGVAHARDDPFDLVRRELGTRLPAVPGVPFAGGALGYWGYDLALPAPPQAGPPDMAIGIYDWAIVFDHERKCAQLVSHRRHAETEHRLPEILERIHQGNASPAKGFSVEGEVTSNFTSERYAAAFARIQDYLQAGDCYQVNLAQRFRANASGDALHAYLALRQLSPAPYSAFLSLPEVRILCASPERFLCVQGGNVETRPIKGTRRRGATAQEDALLAEELRSHPKDRAENLMIVDLLRNDLGKSCTPGSVRAPRLFEVESYANVHHLVSTVQGRLGEGRDALHLLRDCFPGGSVTGAPKRRAMQIIAELEPHPRGVYCGAIGYVGYDGNMDSNIVIRTLVHSGDEICCWAGGGIVADSDVEAEYRETLDKASAMLEVLKRCTKPGRSSRA